MTVQAIALAIGIVAFVAFAVGAFSILWLDATSTNPKGNPVLRPDEDKSDAT